MLRIAGISSLIGTELNKRIDVGYDFFTSVCEILAQFLEKHTSVARLYVRDATDDISLHYQDRLHYGTCVRLWYVVKLYSGKAFGEELSTEIIDGFFKFSTFHGV